jgi:hypothetical protein
MREQPDCQRGSALATPGFRRRIVTVTINVENMHFVGRAASECLRSPNDNTAVTTDQQRNVARLLEQRNYTLDEALPDDSRTWPTSDWRNRVMWQVAGKRDIAIIEHSTTGRPQAREYLRVAISTGVIFRAGI